MCLAIPARVLSVEDEVATVDLEGTRLHVNLSLVEGVAPGDHVLIHAGFALEVLSDADAQELAFYRERMRAPGAQESMS